MAIVLGIAAIVAADILRVILTVSRAEVHGSFVSAAGELQSQRSLDRANTLLDTVAAALLVVGADGRIQWLNRAARRLAGDQADRLQQLTNIGNEAAQEIAALVPGARRIVHLADGQQVLVAAARFSIPGEPSQRLISLQRVAGELDAVELKAWQDVSRLLAHEIMNSLTPISSLLHSLETLFRQALRQPEAVDEVAGALEAIKRRSDGLMSFVERYRRITELPEPQLQPVSLQSLLSGIERLMRATFQQRGIAFLQAAPHDMELRADAALLEQALLNLLRNAIEACVGQAVSSIELRCEQREEQVFISVADNGCGLDEAARSQLFMPFFTTKVGGAGIGLNFTRQVAVAHGGRLEVHANEPRGARFILILPLARSTPAPTVVDAATDKGDLIEASS